MTEPHGPTHLSNELSLDCSSILPLADFVEQCNVDLFLVRVREQGSSPSRGVMVVKIYDDDTAETILERLKIQRRSMDASF